MLIRPGTLQLVLQFPGPPDADWACGPGSREFDVIDLDLREPRDRRARHPEVPSWYEEPVLGLDQ